MEPDLLMQMFIDIFLRATEILTVVIGFTGLIASALLLFDPAVILKLSRFFNRTINLDKFIPLLNRPISSDGLAYRHPVIFGLAMIVGSFFVLNFLFFQLSPGIVTDVIGGILFEALVILGKLVGVFGIVLGLALIIRPESVKRLEKKLDSWFDTESLADKLNQFHPGVDHVFLRHPLVFGAVGLLASFVLLILSLANLYR